MSQPPTLAEQLAALGGEKITDVKTTSSSTSSSLLETLGYAAFGLGAAAVALGVIQYTQKSKSSSKSSSSRQSNKKKRSKKNKNKNKKQKTKKAAPTPSQPNPKRAAATTTARPQTTARLSTSSRIPGAPSYMMNAAIPGRNTESGLDRLINTLIDMMAAKYGTALCLASMGKTADAIKLGYQTESQRSAARKMWKKSAELVGDDPKAAYNGQVPPTQLNRAELTLSPHLRTVRNLLQFNMVDAAFKTMQETLQKTPILTSSYGDVSKGVRPIELLILATQFAATGPAAGAKAYNLVQRVLAQVVQKIAIGHDPTTVKPPDDGLPSGVDRLRLVIDVVLKNLRVKYSRFAASNSQTRQTTHAKIVTLSKTYTNLCGNVWGSESPPALEASLAMVNLLMQSELYRLPASDINLCVKTLECIITKKQEEFNKREINSQVEMRMRLAVILAMKGRHESALENVTLALSVCQQHENPKELWLGKTNEKNIFVTLPSFNLSHFEFMMTLFTVSGKWKKAKDVLDSLLNVLETNIDVNKTVHAALYIRRKELVLTKEFINSVVTSLEIAEAADANADAAAEQKQEKSNENKKIVMNELKSLNSTTIRNAVQAVCSHSSCTIWRPPVMQREFTMYPNVAQILNMPKNIEKSPIEESALFLSTYYAQAAHCRLASGETDEARHAYTLMASLSSGVGRTSNKSHAVYCESLISIVQLGVTYLEGIHLKEGLIAGEALLSEYEYLKDKNTETTKEPMKESKLSERTKSKSDSHRWHAPTVRITCDQVARMHIVDGNDTSALQRSKEAVVVASIEAQTEIDRQETVRISTEIALDKNRTEALQKARVEAKKKNLSVEETETLISKTEEKLLKTMESKRAMLRRKGNQANLPESVISLQALKGFIHMIALNGNVMDGWKELLTGGLEQYNLIAEQNEEKEEKEENENGKKTEKTEKIEVNEIEEEKEKEAPMVEEAPTVEEDPKVEEASTTTSTATKTATPIDEVKERNKKNRLSDREQIIFAIGYGTHLLSSNSTTKESIASTASTESTESTESSPDTNNTAWNQASYAAVSLSSSSSSSSAKEQEMEDAKDSKEKIADMTKSGPMRLAFVAIDQGSRYQKTGQGVLAFKYYRIGWEIITHVTDPKQGRDVWVMMLRDSIRVLLALQPKELMDAGYNVNMIPLMIDVLVHHKLTNDVTMKLLQKKNNEIIDVLMKETMDKEALKNKEVTEEEVVVKEEVVEKKEVVEEDVVKEEVFDPDDVATSSPAPAALPQFDHADDDLMDVE